jgi:hypothetical protein
MFGHLKRPLTMLAILLALAACSALLSSAGALAGKPDKPGKPGGGGNDRPVAQGEIYFRSAESSWVMSADGSGKLPAVDGEPSHAEHGGYLWFLQVRTIDGQFFPNGDPREEVFAVREDGNEALTVQLTTDPMVQPLPSGAFGGAERPNWATDAAVVDGKISFTGRRFDEFGTVVEMGIYTAVVAFDDLGPLAAPETLVWDLAAYPPGPNDPPSLARDP